MRHRGPSEARCGWLDLQAAPRNRPYFANESVVRRPSQGTFCMYMQNPVLRTAGAEGFPITDAAGNIKSGYGSCRLEAKLYEKRAEWWHAEFIETGSEFNGAQSRSELRFSSTYISWVDSLSPSEFRVYTPLIQPSSCEADGSLNYSDNAFQYCSGYEYSSRAADWSDRDAPPGWCQTRLPYTGAPVAPTSSVDSGRVNDPELFSASGRTFMCVRAAAILGANALLTMSVPSDGICATLKE